MFEYVKISFNKSNEFQCRISNFDEILFSPNLYIPGKSMQKMAEVIQLLAY